jgi:hypothetical protein
MKYKILFISLFLLIVFDAFSVDWFADEYKNEIFYDIAFKFILLDGESNRLPQFIVPVIDKIIFMDFSINGGTEIIPEWYYLGIGIDAGVGISLFEGEGEKIDWEKGNRYFGFSLGARLYNLFKIGHFYLIPFFGSDFLFIIVPMPYIGIQIGYRIFSIEYAYYIPVYKATLHQISIKIDVSSIILK